MKRMEWATFWTAVGALCAAITIMGIFFMWIVITIARSEIRNEVNGYKVRIAVQEEKMRSAESMILDLRRDRHELRDNLPAIIREQVQEFLRSERKT